MKERYWRAMGPRADIDPGRIGGDDRRGYLCNLKRPLTIAQVPLLVPVTLSS